MLHLARILPALSLCLCVATSLSGLHPTAAHAQSGAAGTQVAIVDTPSHAYGYSSYEGTWTATALDAAAEARLAGGAMGYLRTPISLYAFNAANGRWTSSPYAGLPEGESAEGSTVLFWSSETVYAIASLWAAWRSQSLGGEAPLGGGSAGTFGLAWTAHHAWAFHSASGQWMHQPLPEGCSGGITLPDLGLVWSASALYTFDPVPGGWVALDLGSPEGISVTAASGIALAWSAHSAVAYSSALDAWIPLEGDAALSGGTAGGGLGLVWSHDRAWAFESGTGLWSETLIEGMPDPPPPVKDTPMDHDPNAGKATAPGGLTEGGVAGGPAVGATPGFTLYPNPVAAEQVHLALPPGGERQIRIFDAAGRAVRTWTAPASARATILTWDRTGEDGTPLAAGVYWARAESRDAVDVRKLVLLD